MGNRGGAPGPPGVQEPPGKKIMAIYALLILLVMDGCPTRDQVDKAPAS